MPLNSCFRFLVLFTFWLLPLLTSANDLDSLKRLLDRAQEPALRLEVLYQLTNQLYSTKPQEALDLATEALAIAAALEDREMLAQTNFLLIYIHYFLGNAAPGIEAGRQATRLARAINDPQLEADSYYILGYHYYDTGEIEQAEASYRQCLAISLKHAYPKGISKGSKGLGDLKESSGNYQEAIRNYEKCLEIGVSIQDQRGTMIAYNDLGRIYDQMGVYDLGLKSYLNGLELAEAAQDTRVMASLHSNIASLHFFQKNYSKALDYAAQAEKLFLADEDEAGLAKILQTTGNVRFQQGEYETALRLFGEALEIQQNRNNQRALSYAYFNLAKTQLRLGKMTEGLELHRKSLALREKMDFQLGIAASSLAIGKVLFAQQQFDRALEYLHRSRQLAEKTGAYQEMNDSYFALADCYSQKGDYRRAYEFQLAGRTTGDSLFNQDRNQALANMQVRFETEKKEAQIYSLKQEKVLFAGMHTKDQQVKVLLATGLALLLALALLIWNQLRLKQGANALLRKKNTEIAQQQTALERALQEKEVLLREVHHRVKNNLQMVSSLLNLQASEVTNESVLDSIREGKSRVEAMSMIHENLYQSDQLNEIDIQAYLAQLLGHLERAFAQKGKSIKLMLEAADIRFDIDTAIPLGLVVNELVTNAYKYAFSEQDLGEIVVSIKPASADTYELWVTDNGKGVPSGFELGKANSLGLRLVNMLASLQLKGALSCQQEQGTQFMLQFQDSRRYVEKTA